MLFQTEISYEKDYDVIDATGDGDVAEKCGVPYTLGREVDGKMQPATLMFKVGGVDMERAVFPGSFETLVPTEKGELQSLARAEIHDDYVVYNAYFNFDVHSLTGSGLDKTGCQKNFVQKKGYTIPYGCLVPREIDGLLLSGRNISGTHMAHSNFRAMPICMGTGEAAGVAASLCIKQKKEARDIDVKDIQRILKR